MHTRLLVLTLLGVATSPALADRGGGGGGGRLGQVSAGLATATGSSAASSGSSASRTERGFDSNSCARYRDARAHDPTYLATILERDCRGFAVSQNGERLTREGGASSISEPGAWVAAFAGAQKVYDSDGSLTLALSIVDQRLRLNGSFTNYYETEMTGEHISMMVPELTGGIRLTPAGRSNLWVEGGVMYVKTSDSRGGSSLTGPSIGARVEHRVSPDLSLVGTAEAAFLQDGVRVWAGRAGVRFHHVEAAFRVLDLSVGPALFGPELGVGF